MGLFQREVAQLLGVNTWTVLNWEKGYTEPPITAFPAILKFLGYDPFPKPEMLQEHLVAKRREMGWTISEAAIKIGVDPGTWGGWERGKKISHWQHREKVAQLLKLPTETVHPEIAVHWDWLHKK